MKISRTFNGLVGDIGPSVLRATSGLAEQLRETTIFGIFPLAGGPFPAFTPEGIVVGFLIFAWVPK